MNLTKNQAEAMERLSNYAGQRVLVITSQYELGMPRVAGNKGLFNASTLRGLAAKGLIKLDPFWRGAWVTVPAKQEVR